MKSTALSFFFLLVTLFGIAIAQEPDANVGLRQRRTNKRRLGKGSSDDFGDSYEEWLTQGDSDSGKGDSVSSTVMKLNIKKTVAP